MRLAWTILMRAVRDILDNIVPALQITVVPLLLMTLVGQHWLDRAVAIQRGFLIIPGRFVWWMWALGLAGTLLPLLWIAVGWHRFILRGERPWLLMPRLPLSAMARYAWRSFTMVLLTITLEILGLIVLGLPLLLLLDWLRAGPGVHSWLPLATGTLSLLLFTFIFLNVSPVLVGAACGERVSLRDAVWANDGGALAMLVLSVLNIGLLLLFGEIEYRLHLHGIVLGGYDLASNWFLTLLGIGILTTIYRQFVDRTLLPLPRDRRTPTP